MTTPDEFADEYDEHVGAYNIEQWEQAEMARVAKSNDTRGQCDECLTGDNVQGNGLCPDCDERLDESRS